MNTVVEQKEPKSRLTEIAPSYALELLVNNTMNRPVSYGLVDRIASEITRGAWEVNGDTIRLATDGTILDGQHRLLACEKAGISIKTFMVTGLDKDCFSTINTTCRSRTASDVFGISQEKYPGILSAALQWLSRYNLETLACKQSFSISVLKEQLDLHPKMRDSVQVAGAARIQLITKSLAAFLHYEFSRKNKELADAFIAGLVDGFNPDKHHNFALLYQRLIKNFTARSGSKIPINELAITCVKAWNATRKDKELDRLRFESGEVTPKIQ